MFWLQILCGRVWSLGFWTRLGYTVKMLDKKLAVAALRAARDYLREHKELPWAALAGLCKGRVLVPLAVLQWFVDQGLQGSPVLQTLNLSSSAPHLRISGVIKAMGLLLELDTTLRFDNIRLEDGNFVVELRIEQWKCKAPGSGAMSMLLSMVDFLQPGDLMKYLPEKPAPLVFAEENKLVWDFSLLPVFRQRPTLYRWLSAFFEVLTVRSIRFGKRTLVCQWQFRPERIPFALRHIRPEKALTSNRVQELASSV